MRKWLTAALCVVMACATAVLIARQPAEGDLRGTVQIRTGPEVGVWVIAETDDLDTRFRKIVVTDDEGRYVVPDLPDAEYRL